MINHLSSHTRQNIYFNLIADVSYSASLLELANNKSRYRYVYKLTKYRVAVKNR